MFKKHTTPRLITFLISICFCFAAQATSLKNMFVWSGLKPFYLGKAPRKTIWYLIPMGFLLMPLTTFGVEVVEDFTDPNHDLVSNVVKLLDGEHYNLRSGELSYYHEDFNIPGTGLPIRLGRRNHREIGYYYEFATMSIEVPRLEFDKAKSYGTSPGVCSGLRHIQAGSFHSGESGSTTWWTYSNKDLASGIRLHINNQKINFFTREGYQAGTRFPSSADYVSPSNWYIDCVPGSGSDEAWEVHSPDGTIYRMETYESLSTKKPNDNALYNVGHYRTLVYVTSATDKFGNTLNYSYHNGSQWLAKQFLESISASDGRKLTIKYNSDDLVSSIYDNSSPKQRRLDYTYSNNPRKVLHRVTRGDDSYWEYGYDFLYSGSGTKAAGLKLTSLATPTGATVGYEYDCSLFIGDRYCPLWKRTITGPSLPAGMSWDYSYPYIGGGKLVTFIKGPANSQQYVHRELQATKSYFSRPADAGKLLSKTVYSQGASYNTSAPAMRQTSYSWIKRSGVTSDAMITQGWSTGSYSSGYLLTSRMYAYHVSMQLVPDKITTTIDGKTFSKTYSNYDSYDNPKTLTETGNAGTRVTNYSYHNDSTSWIVGKLKNETVSGAGAGITRSFNTQGRLETLSEYGLSTKTFAYNTAGQVESISWSREGDTLTEQFLNYYRGAPRTEIDAESNSLTRTVNPDGTIATETDRNGNRVSFGYDTLHRLASIDTPEYLTSYINWTNSGRTKTTTQGDYRSIGEFDALGRPVKQSTSDLGDSSIATVVTSTEYDSAGRVATQSLPRKSSDATSIVMSYSYDGLNRVTSMTNTANSSTTDYCYTAAACSSDAAALGFGYGLTDARGYTSVYNFEGYGSPADMRLSEIYDNTTATQGVPSRLTAIDRNLYGDIKQVARGATVRKYIYSNSKPRNIEQVIEPETGTTSYSYLSDGTLGTVQTGSNKATSYIHDRVGRLKKINYPGTTPDVKMLYYPNGELKKVISRRSKTDKNIWRYYLNDENDLIEEKLNVDGQIFIVNYSHNNLGQIDSITYPSGLVTTIENDALGRTTGIPNFVTNATYHPNGSLASMKYVNGQIMTITQNTRQLPENLASAKNGNTLVDISYDYDLNNNISQITDPRHGNKTLGYDGVNRLYTANGPWGSGSIRYDDNDNIQSKIIGSQNLSYNYNNTSNLLTGISGSEAYSFSYDDYGNVSGNGSNTFSYDDASNLRISGSNSYRYDGHNRRVIVNNAGSKQYYVYTSSGQLMHRYKPAEDHTTDYVYLAGQLVAKREERALPSEQAPVPGVSPAAGTYTNSVAVSLSKEFLGNEIYYSLDGSDPVVGASNTHKYVDNALLLTPTTTLKAITVGNGYQDSPIFIAEYIIQASKPNLSHASGSYTNGITLTMSTTTNGGEIRYTTDGSTPTSTSTLYSSGLAILSTGTIKAATFAAGMQTSPVEIASYTIVAASPTVSRATGTYINSTSTTIASNTTGGTVRYTTNGSTPTSSSSVYSGSLTFSKTTTLKTAVFATGMSQSPVVTRTYTIKAATPTFVTSAGTYTNSVKVTIKNNTSGGTLRYTTNGSTPTGSSAVYSAAITISSTSTLKAAVFKSGLTTSNVATQIYTIKAATPTINRAAGTYTNSVTVSISTLTSGGTIRYTTNGTTPSGSSAVYSGTLTIGKTTTLKARTFKSGLTSSNTVSRGYTIKALPPVVTYSGSLDVRVNMTAPTPGSVIYYSYSVSGGQSGSGVYSSPLSFRGTGLGSKYTVRMSAYAAGPNHQKSSTTTVSFSYGRHTSGR